MGGREREGGRERGERERSFPLPTEYIQKYATAEALREPESSSESEMSDLSEDEAQDMEL